MYKDIFDMNIALCSIYIEYHDYPMKRTDTNVLY